MHIATRWDNVTNDVWFLESLLTWAAISSVGRFLAGGRPRRDDGDDDDEEAVILDVTFPIPQLPRLSEMLWMEDRGEGVVEFSNALNRTVVYAVIRASRRGFPKRSPPSAPPRRTFLTKVRPSDCDENDVMMMCRIPQILEDVLDAKPRPLMKSVRLVVRRAPEVRRDGEVSIAMWGDENARMEFLMTSPRDEDNSAPVSMMTMEVYPPHVSPPYSRYARGKRIGVDDRFREFALAHATDSRFTTVTFTCFPEEIVSRAAFGVSCLKWADNSTAFVWEQIEVGGIPGGEQEEMKKNRNDDNNTNGKPPPSRKTGRLPTEICLQRASHVIIYAVPSAGSQMRGYSYLSSYGASSFEFATLIYEEGGARLCAVVRLTKVVVSTLTNKKTDLFFDGKAMFDKFRNDERNVLEHPVARALPPMPRLDSGPTISIRPARPIQIRHSDQDQNNHLNSARYINLAMDMVDEVEGWSNKECGVGLTAFGVDHSAELAMSDANPRASCYATEIEGEPARVVEFIKDGRPGEKEVTACRVWFKLDFSRRHPVPARQIAARDIDTSVWGITYPPPVSTQRRVIGASTTASSSGSKL